MLIYVSSPKLLTYFHLFCRQIHLVNFLFFLLIFIYLQMYFEGQSNSIQPNSRILIENPWRTKTVRKMIILVFDDYCQIILLVIHIMAPQYISRQSSMRGNQLPVSATRGQCYKTFLSVIYGFHTKSVFVRLDQKKLSNYKHSGLLRKSIIYGQIFYNIGPRWQHESLICFATFIQ